MVNNKLTAFYLLISFVYMLNFFAYHNIRTLNGLEVELILREIIESINIFIIYFIWFIYSIVSVKTEWAYKNFYSARTINYTFITISFIAIIFDMWSIDYHYLSRPHLPTRAELLNWIISYFILTLLIITNTIHLAKSIKAKGFVYKQ